MYHIFNHYTYLLQGGLNTLKFLFDYLKGIAIGAGAILPGISSGVLCVIFGLYEKLIDSVLNISGVPAASVISILIICISAGLMYYTNRKREC